jgi:Glyoxalase-like domain
MGLEVERSEFVIGDLANLHPLAHAWQSQTITPPGITGPVGVSRDQHGAWWRSRPHAPAGAIEEHLCVEFQGRLFWRDAAAVRHPEDPFGPLNGTGLGRRLLFNRVAEPKTGKNRLHLDIHADPGQREATVTRLQAHGATLIRHVKEPGGEWTVLTDPEGNEFCIA